MSDVRLARGVLITFEGGEGAGKSTHIESARRFLAERGYEVVVVREPGGTEIGEAIRTILLSRAFLEMDPLTELLLYESARAQIVDQVIKPALQSGAIVLCDRFTDSTKAYQGFGRGLDQESIDILNAIASRDIVPDCTILIEVPVAEGLARAQRKGEPDRLESQDVAFHQAVHEGYATLASNEPDRIHTVDGTRDKSDVAQEIARIIERVLADVR